jgi:hypothetical protein
MRLVQSSRLTEEETKRLFAVDAVGGSMRLLQSSRLTEEELVAGAVVKALGGGDDAIVRWLGGACRWCSRQGSWRRRRCEGLGAVVKAHRGGDDALSLVVRARRGGDDANKGLNDGSEEAVAWLGAVVKALRGGDDAMGLVRRLGGGCRFAWLGLVMILSPSREGRLISSNDSDRIRAD